MHSRPVSTMSDNFFTHGLAGIDLHHAELSRKHAPGTVRTTASCISQVRQLVATAFITAGTLLAGEDRADPACASCNQLPA